MSKFGDIDAAKSKQELNARIKVVLTVLFQFFAGSRANTANMIQNFIPHLKRTDRDCGSLPFYSKTYTSHKTNKEHLLLCMISKVVQVYWDMVDDTKTMTTDEVVEFTAELMALEQIAKDGFDLYRVHGKFPNFKLMSKEQITEIEVEEAKAERDEANRKEDAMNQQKEDEAEAKNLMDQALGSNDSTSDDSPSTQSTETEAAGTDEQVGTDGEVFEEAAGAANGAVIAETDDVPLESESSKDTLKESTDATASSKEETGSLDTEDSSDQLSTEEADKCGGDCDTCETHACEIADEAPADTDPDELDNEPADTDTDGDGSLVGTTIDTVGGAENTAIPPMPEEEKDSQAAVDHETGDDQTDDEGDGQAAVVGA